MWGVTSMILFLILGVVCIAGGVAFIVARKQISAVAVRRQDDPYKSPAMLSPLVMLIGGILLVAVGICAILAGLFPTG